MKCVCKRKLGTVFIRQHKQKGKYDKDFELWEHKIKKWNTNWTLSKYNWYMLKIQMMALFMVLRWKLNLGCPILILNLFYASLSLLKLFLLFFTLIKKIDPIW